MIVKHFANLVLQPNWQLNLTIGVHIEQPDTLKVTFAA